MTHALLDESPYRSFSLTEDVEFGIELGLSGHRVAYCDESEVNGEMVTGERAARSQRQRWEGGRLRLIREKVPGLLRAAAAGRSLLCLDLAVDLLVLPLSYITLGVAAIVAIGATLPGTAASALLRIGLLDLLALLAYVCRGWILSGIGPRGAWDLMRVPAYILWKILIIPFNPRPRSWVRTPRER